MMVYEVVILSGKGGTGKTSVAASLAVLAGSSAVVADCDVDAANMHLLLRPDFGRRYPFYGGELAVIDQERCNRCGLCADVCRFRAISLVNGRYTIQEPDCEGCGYCARVCPEQAIAMRDRLSGTVFVSAIRSGSTMVHARLAAGAENSGKLVARVRQEAREVADLSGLRLMLIDGAPGIGCPVISSLSGAHYVILVTEPSQPALHDLERIHRLIRNFRIPAGCIINKHDLDREKTAQIRDFLSLNQIDHLADIPYDERFTGAMIEEKTIVETESPAGQLLSRVWDLLQMKIINKT